MTDPQLPEDWRILLEKGSSLLIGLGYDIGETALAFSTDYLSKAERKNPDIMANVRATGRVADLATWLLVSEDREAFGYWRGPHEIALDAAPIVQYDNEGQFQLRAGDGVAAALAVRSSWDDEDEYESIREEFAEIGIILPANLAEAEVWPEISPEPNDLHRQFYREERAR